MWFKVDDKFHGHRKVRGVMRATPDKRRDVAAIGLWTLAGSWCGNHGTGGFIPLEVLEEWDDHAKILADRLVSAGLWESAEQDGEVGYLFHDWGVMNPLDPSRSGAFGNHTRWHLDRGIVSDECQYCSPAEMEESSTPISGGSSGRIAEEYRGESLTRPDPTRPDPTRPDPKDTRSARSSADESFADFWKLYPRKEGRGQAVKAWRGAVKKAPPERILCGLRLHMPGWAVTEKKFIPHPATWLNGERWDDEIPAADELGNGARAKPRDTWARSQLVRAPGEGTPA